MGNLQGSEGKKALTKSKNIQVNKVKGKKSPVRELFKYQGIRKAKDEPVGSSVIDLSTADASGSLIVITESSRRDEILRVPTGESESGDVKEESTSKVLDVKRADESSSEESVFTDPLLTPLYSVNSDYSDSKPCDSEHTVCSNVIPTEANGHNYEEAIPGTLTTTMNETVEIADEATPQQVVSRRPQSVSVTSNNPGAAIPPVSSFTVTKHRKVELQPSKCLLSPSPTAANNSASKCILKS